MIPILYKSTEKNFNHNGIGFLRDTIFCNVTEERNGLYELELIYPVGSFLYEEITKQKIIKAKSNDRYDSQLFRIYYISKPLDGQIKVKAEHISYDNRRNFIEKVNFSGNCGGALSALKANASYQCPFNFLSDLNISKQFSVERVNILNAIVGANGSIMDTYGNDSDIVRDNFNISIKKEGGLDKNVLICYRKNITGFECEDDDSEVITQIYPFAKVDEEIITLPEKFVSSEYLSKFPNPIICEVDLSSDDVTDIETLRQKANNYFKLTKRDIPKFNYKIDFISLSKTENYKDLKLAEDIGICDYVIVRHESYNINEKHKVIKTVYDTLAEKYESIELGEPKTDLNTIIGNMNNDIKDEINKDKITPGFLDQAIENLTNAITGNDGGYIRLNPPKNPSEILILDHEDINQARIVWRWNKAGLGVSNSGYNGNFIGLTRDGKLVIDEATANKINAALIEAGTITANHLSVTAKEELKKGLVTTTNFEVALNNIKLEVSENYASKTSVENLSKALEEAKKNLKGEISDVSSNLDNLEENINGAFKDGIISEAEAIAIYEQIRQLDKEKLDIDKKYDVIYTNTELKGTVKTNLEAAKTNYINAHSSLKTTINNAISDKVITPEENIDVNNKFNEYNQKLSELSKVLEQAIDAIGSEKVKKLETSTNDKISKIEVNTDGIKQTVNEVQSTVTTHTTQISSVTQKASSLETNLTGITGRVSSVETKTNTIDGKVTSQETRLAEAEQKITTDGIFNTVKNKFTSLSGNNLIPNSVGRLGQKYWNATGHHGNGTTVNNHSDTIDKSRNDLQWLIRDHTGTIGGLYSHGIPVQSGKKYTLSFKINTHRGSDCWVEALCWRNKNNSSNFHPDVEKLRLGRTTSSRENVYTFTVPNGANYINIYIFGEFVDYQSQYPYAHYWLKELRLNEGEISHPWCESNTFSESNIAQTSNEISLKVNKDNVVSSINMCPESVKINSNKIDITGLVKFSDLSNSGSTTINGDNIKSGTIKTMDLLTCNFRGKNMIYIEHGGTLSCDGYTYLRNVHIPLTHPGWDSDVRGSFSCSPNGYFEHDVHVKNEIYARDMGVVGRTNGAFIQVNSIGVQQGGNNYLQIIGYKSNHNFGVDLWYSDKKLKENIIPINNLKTSEMSNKIGLDLIRSIKHYQYNYKESAGLGTEKVDCGYIANELKDINPSLVREVEQGDKSINLEPRASMIIPNLSLAIQEQQKQIEALKKENNELKIRLKLIEENLKLL